MHTVTNERRELIKAPHGVRARLRVLRTGLYVVLLPLALVLLFGLDKPGNIFGITVGVCAAAWLLAVGRRPWREALRELYSESAWLRRLDLLVWNLLFTLLLCEGLLAFAASVHDSPLFLRPDARAIQRINAHRFPPGVLVNGAKTNAQGFNDADWVRPKPEGVTRILALGDSFAFGIVGHERNMLTILERSLSEKLGRPIEVLNFGVEAIGPVHYLYLLRSEGLALEPDLVLVCLFAGNDFEKRYASRSYLHLESWRLHAFARRVYLLLGERLEHGRGTKENTNLTVSDEAPTFSIEAYAKVASRYLDVLKRSPDSPTERTILDTLATLDEIVASAAPLPVTVAVLPSELQVNPTLRRDILGRHGLGEDALDLDRPYRLVAEHLESHGVPVLDLRPALTHAEAESPTYHPRDSHWNTRGNAVAARTLSEFLKPQLEKR